MTTELVRTGVGDCDRCEFPEVQLGRKDGIDLIPAGTKVLLPCVRCGVTALDAMADTEHARHANEAAFARYLSDHRLPLYHWSPRSRRKQIIRHGLRPRSRPTVHIGNPIFGEKWVAGYVCFADTPRWAWALSGAQRSAPAGDWDLWATSLDQLESSFVMPADWANGIHEVRTEHRVYKRSLWLAGTRAKP